MAGLSRKHRKNRCARNGRKNNQLGGVLTNQWTFDGSKIAGVNNYGQVNKVFTDCDYKAPSISVPAGGLPGFAPAASAASSGPLGFLKFWGGKRSAKRTQRKTRGRKQAGGGGGIGYSRTDFEVVGGVNPIANQRALGCESGAVGPSAAVSTMPVAAPAPAAGFLSSLKFWGGKRSAKRTQRLAKRLKHKTMRGGASDLASAFAPPMNPSSPLTLTTPYSAANPVYEAPKAGFTVEAPAGGNNAGMPPYEIYKGYDASKPDVSGPCIQPQNQKGGKRSAKRKTRKTKKRTQRKRLSHKH